MAFKINISTKTGKTYKIETEDETLVGKKIGQKIKGEDISANLAGYELKITGTSDKAGFPGFKKVEGTGLKKELLTYGKGMHQKPKGLSKKPNKKPKGLRLRKTVRGNTISTDIIQINLKVLKDGEKKLEDVFKKEKKSETTEQPTETKPEEKPAEQKEQPETSSDESQEKQELTEQKSENKEGENK